MTVYGLICELCRCDDPNKKVTVEVLGEQVHVFNHRIDTDDVVDFEEKTVVLDCVDREKEFVLEVDV